MNQSHPAFLTVLRPLVLGPGVLALVLALGIALPGGGSAAETAEKTETLDATLQRPEGGKERLSERRGRRLLLDLWATWCLPCREQSEIVHGLAAELEGLEVEVLAVNVGQGPRLVLDHLSRNPSPHPVLLDRGQQIPRRLGIGELPALVLVHEDGTVAGSRTGLMQREALKAWLEEAFGPPAKAR